MGEGYFTKDELEILNRLDKIEEDTRPKCVFKQR